MPATMSAALAAVPSRVEGGSPPLLIPSRGNYIRPETGRETQESTGACDYPRLLFRGANTGYLRSIAADWDPRPNMPFHHPHSLSGTAAVLCAAAFVSVLAHS